MDNLTLKNILREYEKKTFIMNEKEDVVITGLGFFKVMKPGKVEVYTFKEVDVYKRKSFI